MAPRKTTRFCCLNRCGGFPPFYRLLFKSAAQCTSDVFALITDFLRFHGAEGRSDKELKLYDERLIQQIRLDTRRLCELTSAADALGLKQLVDLTSRALAKLIEGKSPEVRLVLKIFIPSPLPVAPRVANTGNLSLA